VLSISKMTRLYRSRS